MKRDLLLLLSCAALAVPARAARRRPPRVPPLTCSVDGQTPLTCAAAQGRTDMIKRFLDGGVGVNDKDRFGATALHWAAMEGRDKTVDFLISRHAQLEARNRLGGTPLHWVAKTNHWQTAQLLLARHAKADAVNEDGWTPLMMAAQSGNMAVVRVLLAYGANPSLRDAAGDTAADLALAARRADIARLLGSPSGAVAAARPPAPRSAPTVAPPTSAPAATMTKAEMQSMIDAAVAKAQKDAAPAARVYSSDADKPTYRDSPNADDYALVIGIENYSDLPQARFAQRDAAAMRAHLLALGYPPRNVVLLQGSKATKTGIVKNVETWLPENVSERSTVFVYYSGHGAPDPKTGKSYLVPWDGDPQFLDDTAYPVTRLYEKLGALKARRVIVALDSCFSGLGGRSVLAKGLRPLVAKTDGAVPGAGKVVALAASGGDQVSGTTEAQGHGLFTYYLLQGLNSAHGAATARSLFDYLSPRVQDAARLQNREQKPQLSADAASASAALR